MYFAWSTMYACPGGVPVPTDGTPGSDDGTSSGGLSGGDVFLIIFFVGFALVCSFLMVTHPCFFNNIPPHCSTLSLVLPSCTKSTRPVASR